ncbi:DUF1801 domain-containing protein [Xanthomonas campestris]|uniref:DUF1801 domain-containing protein n=1 Tax=Xanthomonas campestris TaxID=339 RepID=UPI000E1F70C8|nr:DUF1801 domain-containing protein [Xanthomonas campestris]
MQATSTFSTAHTSAADSTQAVEQFLVHLNHPHKDLIVAVRSALLSADAAIAEGIKWHAPSFRTVEYFATLQLRAKTGIAVVLHRGAKVRALPPGGLVIDDPAQWLRWPAADRAVLTVRDLAHLAAERATFQAVIRQWIGLL